MTEASISLSEAAVRFPELLAETRTRQASFVITENGHAVARLSPASGPAHTCGELAARIAAQPRLSEADAAEIELLLTDARSRLPLPPSKWD